MCEALGQAGWESDEQQAGPKACAVLESHMWEIVIFISPLVKMGVE